MKKVIVIVFAFVHLLAVFGCTEASAITAESVVIDGVSYTISAETPYVVVVPEAIEVGNSDSVYVAGTIHGTVNLSVPSTVTLSQNGRPTNSVICNVIMGTDNNLTLNTSSDIYIASEKIAVEFEDSVPLTGSWSGNITYTLKEDLIKDVTEYLGFTLSSDGTYYVISSVSNTGILDYCNNNLVLPSVYNGKPVRAIGDKAFYAGSGGSMEDIAEQKRSITVTIPESVTSIGEYAFAYFGGTGTKFIVEGENLKTIGKNAFYRSYLRSINLPNSVTDIGKKAFSYCIKLTEFLIPENTVNIGDYAFQYCLSASGGIVIPESVTSMGQNAFESCKKLTYVNWNCKLSEIPYGTFYSCISLKEFYMSDEAKSVVKRIKDRAFYDCESLTSFEFPSGITDIGDYAFYNSGLLVATYPSTASTYSNSFPSGCTLNPV